MRIVRRQTLWLGISVLLLASSCGSGTSRLAPFSVPAPMEPIALDVSSSASGHTIFSLPEEATAIPHVGLTQRAITALVDYWGRILRERCAMREMLQVANGENPKPDPVCRAQ